jgi:hypothetical protein
MRHLHSGKRENITGDDRVTLDNFLMRFLLADGDEDAMDAVNIRDGGKLKPCVACGEPKPISRKDGWGVEDLPDGRRVFHRTCADCYEPMR